MLKLSTIIASKITLLVTVVIIPQNTAKKSQRKTLKTTKVHISHVHMQYLVHKTIFVCVRNQFPTMYSHISVKG